MLKTAKPTWVPPLGDKNKMSTQGKRIAAARKWRGMTQKKLAKAVGVSKGAISQYEQDVVDDVGTKIMLRLAASLEVSVRWIVTGVEPINPPMYVSPDETELLSNFRQLTPAAQEELVAKAREYLRILGPRTPSRSNPYPTAKK